MRVAAVSLVAAVALVACGSAKPVTMRVDSTGFRDAGAIPEKYTCEGDGVSPPLRWRPAPKATRQFAIVVADPDAPKGTFYHWVVWGIPFGTNHLDEGQLPTSAVQGNASSDNPTYIGMCPPNGDRPHHYRFTVYALRADPGLSAGAKPSAAVARIKALALASGTVSGTFKR